MDWVAVSKGLLSRLLYPNPVCLLSVCHSDGSARNVMTISWITAINNHGGFICSINAARYSVKFIKYAGAVFVLNVPVRGMEDLVLAIGGCTGAETDKFEKFGIAVCGPAGIEHKEVPDDDNVQMKKRKLSKKEVAEQDIARAIHQSIALRDCVAHLMCRVESVTENDGHLLLRCVQLAGWTRRAYWDGRNFIPQASTDVEPYLTFLGSKSFGYVLPADSMPSRAGSKDI
uniref:Flavin reductase like domain-containing protein n=1 Tax=Hyaloperonospora arabidopsidis (strain Emoy2) TaxID=559515 RepID=M4BES9_HYAAE